MVDRTKVDAGAPFEAIELSVAMNLPLPIGCMPKNCLTT